MERIQPRQQSPSSASAWRAAGLFAVRYGIGGVMVLAGTIVLVVVPGHMGAYGFASSIGAGLSVVLLNFLYRLSVSDNREREREEEARRYLDEHGVWPEEETQTRMRTRRWVLPQGRHDRGPQELNEAARSELDSGDARRPTLVSRSEV